MSVVIQEVKEVQVFINKNGTVTILQKGWPEDDCIITFPISRIDDLVSALHELKATIDA